MVQFGANPSPGTLYRAGQFLAEELPIRLAHRVRELDTLPNKLNEMPSIEKGAPFADERLQPSSFQSFCSQSMVRAIL